MLHRNAAFLLLSAVAFAAKVPTIDQALSTQSVSAAEISPDGKYVAYTVTQANWDENDFITQIWVASTLTGERYRLTTGKKSSSGPQWSPDSKRIAFTSDRDGKRQIYLISPTGGEASALTAEENGVGGFAWSPDGAWIAFTSSGPDPKWKKDRKDKYGELDVIGGDYTMSHLWRIKVPAEMPYDAKTLPKPEALTKGDQLTVSSFSYSPDGSRIAFTGARDPDLGSQGTQQIYLLDLADLHVRKLLDSGGPNSNPKWSPDGKQIAYVTANGQEFYFYANRYIAAISADGGSPRILTSEFDEDPNLIDWSVDGIYFTALQKTAAHAFRVDPSSKAIKRISGPDVYHLNGVTFTKDHRVMAGTGAMPNHFAEIITSSTSDFVPKILTDVAAQYKEFALATREVVEWTSSDGGAKMQGILIKPADYDPSRKYPLMVVIHGGPTGVDTPILSPDRYYPVEMFGAKGALILKPNYRGSAGYGAKFRALNVRDLGTGDYADVISGVDSLIAKGLVDKDRVASMGWSEGGYISAFITCFSDRFKAVSVGAGISDWMTYYVNTDIHPFTRQYLKATPWDDPEIYRKTSPITYVNKAKTPTLIQQGDQDKRVPPPNSYELYQALKDRGVPVKLVFYKGFGHPINKPKQQRSVMEENYAWFSKYIWGEDN
ncbi:MAG TPA: S9 family peptidase [Bryobacteraceae bacterium]|nr:S9 family peptidase [Bryobacteraceae bacterium]